MVAWTNRWWGRAVWALLEGVFGYGRWLLVAAAVAFVLLGLWLGFHHGSPAYCPESNPSCR